MKLGIRTVIRLVLASTVLASSACSGQVVVPPPVSVAPVIVAQAPPVVAAAPPPPSPPRFWSEPLRSPRPGGPGDPRDEPLQAICGERDVALQQTARVALDQLVIGKPLLDTGEHNFTLGALGDP